MRRTLQWLAGKIDRIAAIERCRGAGIMEIGVMGILIGDAKSTKQVLQRPDLPLKLKIVGNSLSRIGCMRAVFCRIVTCMLL